MTKLERNRHGLFMIVFLFVFCGCVPMPMPESTIAPPKVKAETQTRVDEIVEPFLENDNSYFQFDNSGGQYPVITDDFDGDGQVEMLLFYGNVQKKEVDGAMILEEEKQGWVKKWDTNDGRIFNVIRDFRLIDLAGDGQLSLVLELGYYTRTTMIQILALSDEVTHMYTTECNTLEVILEDGVNPSLAIWIRDVNIIEAVDYIEVVRWDNTYKAFKQVSYEMKAYYENLIPYYEQEAEGTYDYSIQNYYLADVLMKAGYYEDALEVINDYLSEPSILKRRYIVNGNYVKAKCAYMIDDKDTAMRALTISNKPWDYDLDKRLEAYELTYIIYMEDEMTKKASDILEEMVELIDSYSDWDYKKDMWLARVLDY